jgi:hypothetical protein
MSRRPALAALIVLVLSAGAARAQVPVPAHNSLDVAQRSGLFTRLVPVPRTLPPDPKRDIWQDTGRWADPHESHAANCLVTGGLYGRYKWKSDCVACNAPNFAGNPGANTMNGPTCPPAHSRLLANALHPFKPVSYYYTGGCYAPIYDLDPLVPGPGPFPFPRMYLRKPVGD